MTSEGIVHHVEQVEQMESRLKEDILAEVERTGGRMLLHREEYSVITGHSDIIGYWEVISAEDVQTPAEMYANLRAEGYNLDYQRIPLTRERAAVTADVDAIHRRLDEYVCSNKANNNAPLETKQLQFCDTTMYLYCECNEQCAGMFFSSGLFCTTVC